MTAETDPDRRAEAVDTALAAWRQGDCVLGEQWFLSRFAPEHPLSPAAQVAALDGGYLAEEQVRGLVVVTQTCDIVRPCVARPFVEVCPLVEVDKSMLQDILRGKRPRYASVPALVSQYLAADLDRTMTLEKPVVACWPRTPGCATDVEARDFAKALARKRARFAFPDDFNVLINKLHNRFSNKHEKDTEEGEGLRALREIRVLASPEWDAPSVALFFWFVRREADADFEGKSWVHMVKGWLDLVPKTGRFTEVEGQVVTLEDMTAADYVGSDPLDLDHLSPHGRRIHEIS